VTGQGRVTSSPAGIDWAAPAARALQTIRR
jgi:hypothetical protein